MKCKICKNCGSSLDFGEICDCEYKVSEWDKVNTFFKSTTLNPFNPGDMDKIITELKALVDVVAIHHYDKNGYRYTELTFIGTNKDGDVLMNYCRHCWR